MLHVVEVDDEIGGETAAQELVLLDRPLHGRFVAQPLVTHGVDAHPGPSIDVVGGALIGAEVLPQAGSDVGVQPADVGHDRGDRPARRERDHRPDLVRAQGTDQVDQPVPGVGVQREGIGGHRLTVLGPPPAADEASRSCCDSVRHSFSTGMRAARTGGDSGKDDDRMTIDARWIVLSGLGISLLGLGATWTRSFTQDAVTALSSGEVGRLLLIAFLVGAAGVIVSFTTAYQQSGFWVALAAAVIGCVVSSMFLVEENAELGPVVTLLGSGAALAFGVNELRGWTLRSERPPVSISTCGSLLVAASAVVVGGGALPLVRGAAAIDAAITLFAWWPSGLLAVGALICGANARRADVEEGRRWAFLLFGSLGLVGGGAFSWFLLDAWQQLGIGFALVSYGVALPAATSLVAPVLGLLASDNHTAESFEISAPVQTPNS